MTQKPDITLSIPQDFILQHKGEVLWRGSAEEFAALMAGMRWEYLGINSQTPTHRRLVSPLFPIEEGD